MQYSIRYLNVRGITERSEFLPFETDADAQAYAATGLPRHAIVEVWKADSVLTRSLRDAKASS